MPELQPWALSLALWGFYMALVVASMLVRMLWVWVGRALGPGFGR